jgi:hypothetical protein
MLDAVSSLGRPCMRQRLGLPSGTMRIDSSLRRAVAFIGFEGDESNGGIQPIGTCFFLRYDGEQYLVTAQHVALAVEDRPFVVRLNQHNNAGALNVHVDPLVDGLRWHTTHNVDIAAMHFTPQTQVVNMTDVLCIPEQMAVPKEEIPSGAFIGDMTYTIGLFRVMAGKQRNVPVVHCGNISLLSGEEPIIVRDWMMPRETGRERPIEAHLVEQQSLQGLSGAPVFVRSMSWWQGVRVPGLDVAATGLMPTMHLYLLGVWQGAWDARPEDILAVEHGKNIRVPVGMGVVSPVEKLREILEMDDAKALRVERKRERDQSTLPEADAIFVPPKNRTQAEPEDANPSHKEDFIAVLGEAAQGQPKDG